ncbi:MULTISPECIES: anti-phage-associated helicase HerA [unclassified Rhizobium]|uniref:anti-phage-associated helicase HerA n=1 Tax=unclassified Rhizobium TaxID=2613769 RepID=UPI0007EA68E2|nr:MULTISPECIES: anti-phage-associated helicase HerA [unclassified Rhizobium]ANK91540.1 AAA domain-containing protein [Rhizobium sp. N6212]ANK97573.1 AAA domain-containing protein [Rhizobium sp. N621]
MSDEVVNAEVVSVYPNKVRVAVDDLVNFQAAGESLRVGSFLKVSDNDNVSLICIIESFSIEMKETKTEGVPDSKRVYMIDAYPLGTLKNGKFNRGGDELAIPPKKVVPATKEEIAAIYAEAFEKKDRFRFSSLTRQRDIDVPVHGDRFFNKHIAVVGASGSGKSSSVSTVLQKAISAKNGEYQGLNNSHILIFDLHSEYAAAFPKANVITVDDLILPYWLLNEDEMEDMFLESGDNNNYNQEALLRSIITVAKRVANPTVAKVNFDSPLRYNIDHLANALRTLTREKIDSDNSLIIKLKDGTQKEFVDTDDQLIHYCTETYEFAIKATGVKKGPYADGSIDKFERRVRSKVTNARLGFLFGDKAKNASLEDVLRQFTGYADKLETNVTIIDLSGIPFELLSITVSLISRLMFDFCYYARRAENSTEQPFLMVYEEAHKYAPKSGLARYKASLAAIERIAKEGRKYGISLLISSQRPSEISETIFSQCSNFLAMRLTNPDDQSYVRRLLPDTLGNLTEGMPALEQGEALLIGDAVIMPCVVYVEKCDPEPASSDVRYLTLWKEQWKDIDFKKRAENWRG